MDPPRSSSSSKVEEQIVRELLPFIRVYKDGRIERLCGLETIPASQDPDTLVTCKDILIVPETGVSARVFMPHITSPTMKLPLVVFFHGGRFVCNTAMTPAGHRHLNLLVSKGNLVVVNVDYRKAPEHPIPTAYNDAWDALEWVGSYRNGHGSDPWLVKHVDFDQVFLYGASTGGNIVHNIAMQVGQENRVDLRPIGIALVQPFFWGEEPIGTEADDLAKKKNIDIGWPIVCPSSPSNDDPRVNPVANGAPSLAGLGCDKVIMFVAGKDLYKHRQWVYYDALKKSGWGGELHIVETEGEDHLFHIHNQDCEKALQLIDCLVSFFTRKE